MKRKIVNFGLSASHDLVTTIGSLHDGISISDFDAFVCDAGIIRQGSVNLENLIRRQNEIYDLVSRKGGIVVCVLRQAELLGLLLNNRQLDSYSVFDKTAPRVAEQIRSVVRFGEGLAMQRIPGASGAADGYLRILQGNLRWVAYLDIVPENLSGNGGTTLSIDSVGHPVCAEFVVGAGRVCFVPAPSGAVGERVGSALVRVIEAHYGGLTEIAAPPWALEVSVPGSASHDLEIGALENRVNEIQARVDHLKQERSALANYRLLLYGYGKSVLEPVVRAGFRLLGFGVPDPDDYRGEWDAELNDERARTSVICEIEGSEGPIDVDKYRQLLDYIDAEILEGREHKGILVGNGYRLTALDAPERQNQFSDHAVRGAKRNAFCLLPTTELFKAVCAVLSSPGDEDLKREIRSSIVGSVGVWSFALEVDREAGAGSPASQAASADK